MTWCEIRRGSEWPTYRGKPEVAGSGAKAKRMTHLVARRLTLGPCRTMLSDDPLPTLPNEGVPEALAVRRDHTGGGTGKMDRQDKRAGVSHLPQKAPTRQRGLHRVSVPDG